MSLNNDHQLVPYRVYFLVWFALILLTGVTVGVSYIDMKNIPILTAVMIATVKVTLVVLYFMHLRYERRIVMFMILAFIFTYGIFFGLTMVDYANR